MSDDTRTRDDAATSTAPAETTTPARTRQLIELDGDEARVRHGKSVVVIWKHNGRPILTVRERGMRRCGAERHKVDVTTSVALPSPYPAQVARAIETSVRLAKSMEMIDGHPVWCNTRDCHWVSDGQHATGGGEFDLTSEETANVTLYRRKNGEHRVCLYLTTEYSGESSVMLTLDEAAAVAQLLRFAR
jgi:hypothetical protein